MKIYMKKIITERVMSGKIDSKTRIMINTMAILSGVNIIGNMFGILRAIKGI